MNDIISDIRRRARQSHKHIVFPESGDSRVMQAARFLHEEKICKVTLLSMGDDLPDIPAQVLNILDDPPQMDRLAGLLLEKQPTKLDNLNEAKKWLKDPLYFGAAMVEAGLADGCVAGSVATTAEVIRAAIRVIGLAKSRNIVSSTFLMTWADRPPLTYADCGVVPYPDKHQLADIALESAHTHQKLTEQKPKVAMLSFSTKGSAEHPRAQLVREALAIVQAKNPDLLVDGELQFDAAFVPAVAKRKAPDSLLQGDANIFIFPNLDAGNIAYKITERLAGATATGPILQGLAKPMMDLSRGCDWQDIVNAACVAILMGRN